MLGFGKIRFKTTKQVFGLEFYQLQESPGCSSTLNQQNISMPTVISTGYPNYFFIWFVLGINMRYEFKITCEINNKCMRET